MGEHTKKLLHTCTEPCLSAGVRLPNVFPCLGTSGHAVTPPFAFVCFRFYFLEFFQGFFFKDTNSIVNFPKFLVSIIVFGKKQDAFFLIEKEKKKREKKQKSCQSLCGFCFTIQPTAHKHKFSTKCNALVHQKRHFWHHKVEG